MASTLNRKKIRCLNACMAITEYVRYVLITENPKVRLDAKGTLFKLHFNEGNAAMWEQVILPECRKLGQKYGLKVRGREGTRTLLDGRFWEGYIVFIHLDCTLLSTSETRIPWIYTSSWCGPTVDETLGFMGQQCRMLVQRGRWNVAKKNKTDYPYR